MLAANADIIRECEKMAKGKPLINLERCKGCGLCVSACPKNILELSKERINQKGYHPVEVVDQEKCIGCGRCEDVCWYKGIALDGKKAQKTDSCIGCGYCFQVCPTKALEVDAAGILKSAFEEK